MLRSSKEDCYLFLCESGGGGFSIVFLWRVVIQISGCVSLRALTFAPLFFRELLVLWTRSPFNSGFSLQVFVDLLVLNWYKLYGIEDMFNSMDNLYLTLGIKDLIKVERNCLDLVIVIRGITDQFVSFNALMKVF